MTYFIATTIHSLNPTNAKFERNRLFELYHLVPGFLLDTLLIC